MTILELSPERVREFLLKDSSYNKLLLPEYFIFSPALKTFSEKMENRYFSGETLKKAKKVNACNYAIMHNKDGRYAWRRYQLIHPALYVSLVHAITKKEHWELLVNRFIELKKSNNTIEAVGIPVIPTNELSYGAAQTNNWVKRFERRSIQLGLEYTFLCETDISSCYGSMYTHAIPWAIHSKPIAKNKPNDYGLLGNIIDVHLRAMSYGQTNGIPEGSVLMDLLAEVVLSYIDSELWEYLSNIGLSKEDYTILRYRDDYRIFTNDNKTEQQILKALSETLSSYGMHLNNQKTKSNGDVISGSVKADKLYHISHTKRLPTKSGFQSVRTELLYLYMFGFEFPNCGTIEKRLKILEGYACGPFDRDEVCELVSLLINIALNHPRVFPKAIGIIARLLANIDHELAVDIVNKIKKKIGLSANTGYMDVWLQRITIHLGDFKYSEPLCELIYSNTLELFKSEWLDEEYRVLLNNVSFIDRRVLAESKLIIPASKTDVFSHPS